MRRSVCSLAFAVFLAGCANFPQLNPGSNPNEKPRSVSDVNALEKELSTAKARNVLLEAQAAESARKIETLTQGIRDLRKEMSTLEATIERLRRENIIAKNFSIRQSPQKSMEKPKVASITPQALYNKSYRAVRDGKNEAAIRGFLRFLRLFPKNQLVPHSQYWLGESYYGLRQYHEALNELLKLITRYPKSKKVPDAYYKRGLIYIRRKFPLNASLEFENLVEKFPAHPLSKKAKVQLQNLKHYTRKKPDENR